MGIADIDTLDTTYRIQLKTDDGDWIEYSQCEYETAADVHQLASKMYGGLERDEYRLIEIKRTVVPPEERQSFGPYDTESAAVADARDVLDLPPSSAWDSGNLSKLMRACEAQGVTVGSYDLSIMQWLSRGEPQAVQAIVGLISRAGAR